MVNGLSNLGNTCYLNSCIQVLLRMDGLNDYLRNKHHERWLKNKPESIIMVEWDNLRQLMESHNNCTISPNAFVHAVQKVATYKDRDIFTGYSQNDMPEFLLFFMDCIHTSVSREVSMKITGKEVNSVDKVAKMGYESLKGIFEKDYSEMVGLFYCINVTLINDVDCDRTVLVRDALSIKCDPVFMIDLPIPSNLGESNNGIHRDITIFDCMDAYCSSELLEGPNAWYNEKLNKRQRATRRTLFLSLPEYMIIDLKRFNNRMQKVKTRVDVPLKGADFSRYVCGYNRNKYIYDVYGVIMHVGGVDSGHYTCNILGEDGKWREMNDTSIREINEREVINANAYCIFYKKV